MSSVRRRYFFAGRVQGVGFRFTTVRVARRFPVVGYVKNLADGRVELGVEADEDVVGQFLVGIEQELPGHIESRTCEDIAADEVWDGFEIRR
jgi:acylphosphatase